jgi:hypothetical protein
VIGLGDITSMYHLNEVSSLKFYCILSESYMISTGGNSSFIQKVPNSNLGWGTDYPDLHFSCLSSVPPRKKPR